MISLLVKMFWMALLARVPSTMHIRATGGFLQIPISIKIPDGWAGTASHPQFIFSIAGKGLPWFRFHNDAFAAVTTFRDPSGSLSAKVKNTYRLTHRKHPEYESNARRGGVYYPCIAGTSGLKSSGAEADYPVWGEVYFLDGKSVLGVEFYCRRESDVAKVVSFAKAMQMEY